MPPTEPANGDVSNRFAFIRPGGGLTVTATNLTDTPTCNDDIWSYGGTASDQTVITTWNQTADATVSMSIVFDHNGRLSIPAEIRTGAVDWTWFDQQQREELMYDDLIRGQVEQMAPAIAKVAKEFTISAEKMAEALAECARSFGAVQATAAEIADRLRVQAEAEAERRRIEREEQMQRRVKAVEARRVAESRGMNLLSEILAKHEFDRFRTVGFVDVPSKTAGRVYRIRPKRRIAIVDGGRERKDKSLCIHPAGLFVEGDVVASQVLLARFDEKRLLETANVHRTAA